MHSLPLYGGKDPNVNHNLCHQNTKPPALQNIINSLFLPTVWLETKPAILFFVSLIHAQTLPLLD